ncbi:MAG: TIGR01212 family radical SAM protein [Lachnospiraceae bacterium]|nr:TIGR01212 family radical SAM protein [Lachnospiraceae bacterium]
MLLNTYLKETFGCKVYKIALNGGFTCPNRDGKIDSRGCIFCSAGGSGDFAESSELSVTEQIEAGKKRLQGKIKDGKYIAYFQAFTNTYGPADKLQRLFTEAINHPDVASLSIATRPDCLPLEVLALLSELNKIKPVWVELGLQTINEESAKYIRRGYPLSVYDKAVKDLKDIGINVITHVILGLPGESKEDMLDTVRYVCKSGTDGIKLQLLHVLKGTDLEKDYLAGKFAVLSEDEYVDIIEKCLKIIPPDVVIHRLTGDGDKKILVAPLWSGDKKHVINRINAIIKDTDHH